MSSACRLNLWSESNSCLAYVTDLKALIRNNRLDGVDDAYLRHIAVIHIVPAAIGPKPGKPE
jgi:hypothetical protein